MAATSSIHREVVRFGPDNRHSGYLVYPVRAQTPIPAVIVIQEAWGVDDHIEDVAERVAKAGYLAFAPDLYSDHGQRAPSLTREKIEVGKEAGSTMPAAAMRDPKIREEHLAKFPENVRATYNEAWGAIMKLIMDLDSLVPKLLDSVKFVQAHPVSNGAKVGSVGFCMGGGLSVRLACAEPSLAGSIIYYGTAPSPVDRVATINCPVLGHYGSLDERINLGIPELAAAMTKHGKKFTSHMHEGAQHAFNNETTQRYHCKAARDSWALTLEFFRVNLQ